MYAKLIDLDKDGHKGIVAVLDPEDATDNNSRQDKMSRRELGVWKVENGNLVLVSKIELPKTRYLGDPRFGWAPMGEKNDITLFYTQNLGCDYVEGKLICQDEKVLELQPIESQKTR